MKRKLAVVTAMIIALAVSNQVIAQTNSNSNSTWVQDHSEALVTDQKILDELKIASPPSATPQTTGVKFTAKTGETPYAYCYGENKTCTGSGCSQIKVITPNNSDVLVTLKQNERVVAHAYISAGSNYTFQVPNGTYQPFFYYGRNWDSEKEMAKTNCGTLRGGFTQNEHFSKDTPETLSNDVLTYELILQQNGNFSTIPSNRNEAF